MKRLVYLHGFLSSPDSYKARQTRLWLEHNRPDINYQCPALSSYPGLAIERIRELMAEDYEETLLIGSSLGGYWCTWLAEEYGHRAVVINPAVQPSMFEAGYLGQELKNFHTGQTYVLGDKDIAQLKSVFIENIQHPHRIWLMVQTGDQTCDYHLAVEKYKGSKQLVEAGGDHGFQGYADRIPEILEFLEKD